ncbi:hypothetical protein Tco_1546266 [Tanacetum coccineum]
MFGSRETFAKIGNKWGEALDIEDNFGSSFARKRLCILTKQPESILEKFKVIFKGKVFVARAKELFTWIRVFLNLRNSPTNGEDMVNMLSTVLLLVSNSFGGIYALNSWEQKGSSGILIYLVPEMGTAKYYNWFIGSSGLIVESSWKGTRLLGASTQLQNERRNRIRVCVIDILFVYLGVTVLGSSVPVGLLSNGKEIVVANKMRASSVSASFRRDVRDGAERQQWDDFLQL